MVSTIWPTVISAPPASVTSVRFQKFLNSLIDTTLRRQSILAPRGHSRSVLQRPFQGAALSSINMPGTASAVHSRKKLV